MLIIKIVWSQTAIKIISTSPTKVNIKSSSKISENQCKSWEVLTPDISHIITEYNIPMDNLIF